MRAFGLRGLERRFVRVGAALDHLPRVALGGVAVLTDEDHFVAVHYNDQIVAVDPSWSAGYFRNDSGYAC